MTHQFLCIAGRRVSRVFSCISFIITCLWPGFRPSHQHVTRCDTAFGFVLNLERPWDNQTRKFSNGRKFSDRLFKSPQRIRVALGGRLKPAARIRRSSLHTSGSGDVQVSAIPRGLWQDRFDLSRGKHKQPCDHFERRVKTRITDGGELSSSKGLQESDGLLAPQSCDISVDSYWDPQFKGSVRTFPVVEYGGSSFVWKLRWTPWLARKHPRKGGQPMKSPFFRLGGVEPLQMWFWPTGTAMSKTGFCSVKMVSRPGWCLPFPIILWMESPYSRYGYGPFHRDSGTAVLELTNFCLLKSHPRNKNIPRKREIRIGPAGDIDIGVAVADPSWQWEEGMSSFEQWLKKQSAEPDDEEIEASLPHWYTHSESYENTDYQLIPTKKLLGRAIFFAETSDTDSRFMGRSF